MQRERKTWEGRVFLGRDQDGKQQYWWVGRFSTRRERDDAVALARSERPWERPEGSTAPTVAEYVADTLARMESGTLLTKQDRRFKRSSIDAARGRLGRLKREPATGPLTGSPVTTPSAGARPSRPGSWPTRSCCSTAPSTKS
jgi:hypothetical protein